MKKAYRKFLDFLADVIVKVECTKTFVAEKCAIYRKKSLYKNVKWSSEQQKEFDDFWKENYGKKISNRWHRLYEAGNGIYRKDYMPEIIYSTKIQPKINNRNYCKVFSDKDLMPIFFNDRIQGVRTPKSYVSNSNGQFYDSQRHLITKEKTVELLENVGQAVIKPTVDSGSGKGVIIVDIQNGKNVRDNRTVEEILNSYKVNFVVQEKIKPCKSLMELYPHSINTLRVITYMLNDKVFVAPVSLRIGGGGGEVDNIHAGGFSISVSNNGELGKYAYKLGYGDSYKTFECHPDTKVKFEGYKLGFIERIIDAAKRLHELTANIGIISWDFTVDDNEEIILIETNLKGQSIWFPQILSGKSVFGENTADILKMIRK